MVIQRNSLAKSDEFESLGARVQDHERQKSCLARCLVLVIQSYDVFWRYCTKRNSMKRYLPSI